ncbi:MAG: immunoglobulin domain-containing protein [Opitutaceae bacterium]|nr:immunoglobulin domain-containing protein [Opitutaceae bacterium]
MNYLPPAASVGAGGTARFVAEATGTGTLTYQWYKNGVAIPGATGPTLTVPNVDTTNQGTYTVQVTSSTGSSTSADTTLTVAAAGVSSIVNLAGRADAGVDDTALVTGFVISGSGSKQILLRAAGPALGQFGVEGVMPNPRVRLFKGPVEIGANREWEPGVASTVARLAACPFPSGSLDAALLTQLEPGGYTAVVDDESSRSGVVLAEVYDADPNPLTASARLDNLSLRARVGAGDKILIPGVVVSGNVPRTLLFRGVGPRLVDFGIPENSVLLDPVITLTRGDGSVVASNDDWSLSANAPEIRLVAEQVGAFSLLPGARDSALLVSVPPGQYTLSCSGKNSSEGVALVEVYFVP